nr:M23 family metallopeptidase [Bacillus infantis]MCR6609476.1 M23 family metallopeptidase [Bacillus infantis]
MKKNAKFLTLFVVLVLMVSGFPISKSSAATGYFIMPAQGTITDGFRIPSRPDHHGIDIANQVSVPIKAGREGTVSKSYYSTSYGNVVFIRHNINGSVWETVYAHMSNRSVSAGQKVTTGQTLGYMGNTGDSHGQHLHFEVHNGLWNHPYKTNAVDPLLYITDGTPTPTPPPSITIEDIKPNLNLNTRLGAIRNFETTVIRSGPGASYSINTGLGNKGYVNPKDQYLVSDYSNGWYKIATDGWVYSEHFVYRPTNSISITLNGSNSGTIATPKQVTIEGIKVKPDLNLNQQLGVVRGIEASVIRTGPGASYPINTSAGSEGYVNIEDQYLVYEYSNGWYRIGTNAWVYSEHNNYRPSLNIKIQ